MFCLIVLETPMLALLLWASDNNTVIVDVHVRAERLILWLGSKGEHEERGGDPTGTTEDNPQRPQPFPPDAII